jgi:hypothetical protein
MAPHKIIAGHTRSIAASKAVQIANPPMNKIATASPTMAHAQSQLHTRQRARIFVILFFAILFIKTHS